MEKDILFFFENKSFQFGNSGLEVCETLADFAEADTGAEDGQEESNDSIKRHR